MQTLNRIHYRRLTGLALLILPFVNANAATVIDSVTPAQFAAPTPAELSNANDLIFNDIGLAAGSIVFGLRSGPSNEINFGLDSAEPSTADEDAEANELAMMALPPASQSCPPATPVTISISSWSYSLTDASPAPSGGGVAGSALVDARNPSFNAPATTATAGGSPDPALTIGQVFTIDQASYTGTFQDLPFLSHMTAFKSVEIRGATAYQQAFGTVVFPTIALEYDDAACAAIAAAPPQAQAIPSMGLIPLWLLILLTPIAALKRLLPTTPRR